MTHSVDIVGVSTAQAQLGTVAPVTDPADQAAKIQRLETFLAQVRRSAPAKTATHTVEQVTSTTESSATPDVIKQAEVTTKNLRLLVLNGPNLNLLGTRETDLYGRATLADIENLCREQVRGQNVTLTFFQSNHEGVLVERIQQARGSVDLIIINAAAYTHTSVAIRDALLAVKIPVIEVHLSNIYKREPFRHHSYISDIALGVIVGFGPDGYRCAVDAGVRYLSHPNDQDSRQIR